MLIIMCLDRQKSNILNYFVRAHACKFTFLNIGNIRIKKCCSPLILEQLLQMLILSKLVIQILQMLKSQFDGICKMLNFPRSNHIILCYFAVYDVCAYQFTFNFSMCSQAIYRYILVNVFLGNCNKRKLTVQKVYEA